MNEEFLKELIQAGISFGFYDKHEVVSFEAYIHDTRWTFLNTDTGAKHSIAAEPHISSPERVIAHWKGFVADTGLSIEDIKITGPIGALKMSDIKDIISEEYQNELIVAKRTSKCVASRGKWFMRESDGDQDSYETENCEFKGTKREILEEIEKAKATPSVSALYISGGMDGADSVRELTDMDGTFLSWVGDWSVLIWQRSTDDENDKVNKV